jgi:mannonate dehydratase
MPVLDWSRTDLRVTTEDGAISTRFEAVAFAAFDMFLLKRPRAGDGYPEILRRKAGEYFRKMSSSEKTRLVRTVLLGLPGSLEAYSLESLRSALARYEGIGNEQLHENLKLFLQEIIPVAGESGVFMAIHPDDPPWPLLGLPRVVSNAEDLKRILQVSDSPAHGLTLCTGSLGAACANDLVDMSARFAPRINFVHLRNVSRTEDGDFNETAHLEGDIDLYGVMKSLILEEKRRVEEGRTGRRMPFRPDHGQLMIPDMGRKGIYPGYSLFGRMRGLAELRGMELGIRRSLGI